MSNDFITVRAANNNDRPFIQSRWFHQVRNGALNQLKVKTKLLPQTVRFINDEIEHLVQKSYTLVAVDPTDPTFILGYQTFQIINGVLIVHFAYTKKPFRGMGIQKRILSEIKERDQSLPIVLTYENARTRHYATIRPKDYILKPEFKGIV